MNTNNESSFISLFIFPMSVESQTNNFTLFADHVIRMKIGTLFLIRPLCLFFFL